MILSDENERAVSEFFATANNEDNPAVLKIMLTVYTVVVVSSWCAIISVS